MTHKMFTVYDSKSESYSQPFIQKHRGEAIRGFIDVANDKQTGIGLHPEDYTLFEIAEWDERNAQLQMYDAKISCGLALEFVKEKKLEVVNENKKRS